MDANLIKMLEKFKDKKIIVLGDIMLDKYIFGNVERISPEAPVQIVGVEKERFIPGGAANVANNIAALDAKVFMVGIVGKDIEAKILLKELKKRKVNIDGIVTDNNVPTTQKVRVFGQKQQLLRIDYEKKDYLNKEAENKIIAFIKEKIKETDAIIISDYAKGVITKDLMANVKELAKGILLIVDPKPKHKAFYAGVNLITPNVKEAREMSGKEEVNEMGRELMEELNAPVLITRGEKGMSLFEWNGVTNIATEAKEVFDVSGAGDTTVAALTLALTAGATLEQAAILANHAAGITVEKIGASTVSIKELKKSLEKND